MMIKLHNLPLDVLFCVLGHLERTDLLNLSHASHALRQVSCLKLWRTVSLGADSASLMANDDMKPRKYAIDRRNRISMTVAKIQDLVRFVECSSRDNVLSSVETLRVDSSTFKCSDKCGWWVWGWRFDHVLRMLARRCTSLRVLEYKPSKLNHGAEIDREEMNRVLQVFDQCIGMVRVKIEISQIDVRLFEDLQSRRVGSLILLLGQQAPLRQLELVQLPMHLCELRFTVATGGKGWTTITDEALTQMLSQCTRLKTLTLEGGFAIKGLGWLPVSVKDLALRSRDALGISSLTSLDSNTLTRLELDFAVGGCKAILLMNCPHLDTLDVKLHDEVESVADMINALQTCLKIRDFTCSGLSSAIVAEILNKTRWSLNRLVMSCEPETELESLFTAVTKHSAHLHRLMLDRLDNWVVISNPPPPPPPLAVDDPSQSGSESSDENSVVTTPQFSTERWEATQQQLFSAFKRPVSVFATVALNNSTVLSGVHGFEDVKGHCQAGHTRSSSFQVLYNN